MPGTKDENWTAGLDTLAARAAEYYKMGTFIFFIIFFIIHLFINLIQQAVDFVNGEQWLKLEMAYLLNYQFKKLHGDWPDMHLYVKLTDWLLLLSLKFFQMETIPSKFANKSRNE